MLQARRRLKIGQRVYWPGQILTPEDEAELRSRPAFSLLMEEGVVVERHSPPSVSHEPDKVTAQSEDNTTHSGEETSNESAPEGEAPKDDAAGGSAVEADATSESGAEFKCPYEGCQYSSPLKHRLEAHIRMAHEKVHRKR